MAVKKKYYSATFTSSINLFQVVSNILAVVTAKRMTY